jgi:hypothetical protein
MPTQSGGMLPGISPDQSRHYSQPLASTNTLGPSNPLKRPRKMSKRSGSASNPLPRNGLNNVNHFTITSFRKIGNLNWYNYSLDNDIELPFKKVWFILLFSFSHTFHFKWFRLKLWSFLPLVYSFIEKYVCYWEKQDYEQL